MFLTLAGCGGGGGATPTLSTTPIVYVPGTSTVVSNPVTFVSGQSVQFEPLESGYQGTFNITTATSTAGAACISTTPSTVQSGQAFTSATVSGGCVSYPQSVTYDITDVNGHGTNVTVQINAP
jgi:hypothetical protein